MLLRGDLLTVLRDDQSPSGFSFRGDLDELIPVLESEGWCVLEDLGVSCLMESPVPGDSLRFDQGEVTAVDTRGSMHE
ncbi:hypothetical protein ACQXX0_02285 [Corynebacterium diphtheriae]